MYIKATKKRIYCEINHNKCAWPYIVRDVRMRYNRYIKKAAEKLSGSRIRAFKSHALQRVHVRCVQTHYFVSRMWIDFSFMPKLISLPSLYTVFAEGL